MKNIGVFVSENFQFFEVTFSIYLNRSVFVMTKFPFAPTVEIGLRVFQMTAMHMYGKIMIKEEEEEEKKPTKKKKNNNKKPNTFFFFKTMNCSNDEPFFSCNDRI